MGATGEWEIVVHPDQRVIEVIYPPDPSEAAVERYEQNIRAAILKLGGSWDCLVDQRAMPVLTAEMSARIAELITWARNHGMRHAHRIVKRGSMATLQAKQLLRTLDASEETHIHTSREEAWAAVTSGR